MPELNKREVLLIIANILQRKYSDIFFEDKITFSKNQLNLFIEHIERLMVNEPLAKILESKEFYGLNYKTNKYTLDPRPETEFIVDVFQKYFPNKKTPLQILDIGCGTGCIGLTVLALYKNAKALLVDIDQNALEIAISNSKKHNLYARCRFTISNWFNDITGKFDAILTNPPYIENDYNLDVNTLFDPKIALFSGDDGLDAYRKILPNIVTFLQKDGIFITEIGANQAKAVKKLAIDLKLLEIVRDLSGIERTMVFSVNDS
ncbi:MAG: peptide chain release factor N(5)-glutamine methyltransferase [Holosporales bacterium]|jgi:release factor glutamine methyltransferase|nr:peptide chain release factor N(5)-glutamine methyltransferase [Holosporales bacterium]